MDPGEIQDLLSTPLDPEEEEALLELRERLRPVVSALPEESPVGRALGRAIDAMDRDPRAGVVELDREARHLLLLYGDADHAGGRRHGT